MWKRREKRPRSYSRRRQQCWQPYLSGEYELELSSLQYSPQQGEGPGTQEHRSPLVCHRYLSRFDQRELSSYSLILNCRMLMFLLPEWLELGQCQLPVPFVIAFV